MTRRSLRLAGRYRPIADPRKTFRDSALRRFVFGSRLFINEIMGFTPNRNRWITRIPGYDSSTSFPPRFIRTRIGRSFIVIRAGRPKGRTRESGERWTTWLDAPDTMSVMENPGPSRDNTNLPAPINIPFGRGTGCRFGEPRPSPPAPLPPPRSFRRASPSTLISLEFITPPIEGSIDHSASCFHEREWFYCYCFI